MPESSETEVLIVGGGFYGCMIAAHLSRQGRAVRLLERAEKLLTRASYANQARVHQGYHYPRSLITGFRSRANYSRFLQEFPESICQTFDKYYAIGREFSKVSANGFHLFCERIGAPIEPAARHVQQLFDPTLIENVFRVEEVAFDATRLRQRMEAELNQAGVAVSLGVEAERLELRPNGQIEVAVKSASGMESVRAGEVYNCTYSSLNQLARNSGLPLLPLKQEIAEMGLMRMPAELNHIGVTVMCGPFFSCMPFPSAGLHTLSHVRYTPHASWQEGPNCSDRPRELPANGELTSAVGKMVRDAARYMPALAKAEPVRSLWEIKSVLPANEGDDGRPILFHRNCGIPGYHLVLGAKIDNIFDVLERIDQTSQLAPVA